MTLNTLRAEADSLVERIDKALRSRYRVALEWRQANPLRPVPAHLYAQLADYSAHIAEVRRAATLTERGAIRVLRDVLGKVTT